jgi:hypothetical protein
MVTVLPLFADDGDTVMFDAAAATDVWSHTARTMTAIAATTRSRMPHLALVGEHQRPRVTGASES